MAETEKEQRRRLFADVSAVQVIATALAAVTSMLLSSYIGIAGSVIGVAVASIVSTLAASLYKKFLADSAEKIKELPVITKPGETLGQIIPGHQALGKADAADASSPDARQQAGAADGSDGGVQATQALAVGATAASPAHAPGPGDELSAEGQAGPSGNSPEPSGETGSEAEAIAALRRQRRLVRGLIAVCVVSALLAVAASGAVVYFATMGAGLGQKPAPIYLSAPFTPVEDDEDSHASTAASSDANASSNDGDQQEPSDPAEGNTVDNGTDGNTTEGGEGNGNTVDPGDNPSQGGEGSGNTTPSGSPDTPDSPGASPSAPAQ